MRILELIEYSVLNAPITSKTIDRKLLEKELEKYLVMAG